MEGPKIQQPQAGAPMVEGDLPALEYALFFQSLQHVAFYSSRAGTTSERPTATTLARWIGMPYFDQTLGYPVYLKYASSNVWVNGAGTVV